MRQNKLISQSPTFKTVENWAKVLNYSAEHVRRLLKKGKLPGRRLLGRWVTPQDDFEAFFRDNPPTKADGKQRAA